MKKKDTCPEIEKKQIEILKKLSPERKIQIVFELIEVELNLIKEGISKRHPEYGKEEINLALIKVLIGENIFKKIYQAERKTRL